MVRRSSPVAASHTGMSVPGLPARLIAVIVLPSADQEKTLEGTTPFRVARSCSVSGSSSFMPPSRANQSTDCPSGDNEAGRPSHLLLGRLDTTLPVPSSQPLSTWLFK